MIHPSPALTARADTSILECIRLMRDHNVGSVLIVTDLVNGSLIGIFTERDLLKRAEQIQKGGFWQKPIRTVMTSPVVQIDIGQISKAPQVLLKNRFRHLPVTVTDKVSKNRVLGVISMRDLFRQLVVHQESQDELKLDFESLPKKMKIAIETRDPVFLKFFKKLLGSIEEPLLPADFLIYDLDGFTVQEWQQKLKVFNQARIYKKVVIAFNPFLYPPPLVRVLEKLGKSKKFVVFKKPLEVFQLLELLRA